MSFDRFSLQLQAGTDALTLVLALAALAALVVLGARSVGNLSRARTATLVVLRCLLALVLVSMALRPELRRENVAVSAAPVAVVVDASASMGVRDQPGGATRLEAVSRWIAASARELDALEEGATVDWFVAADGELRAVSRTEAEAGRWGGPGPAAASGWTDLASSLKALAERYPGRGRPATLLVSDGADHGELAAALAADLPLPVDAGGPVVAIAPDATGYADRAVELAAHDPVGFLRTEMTVRARVRSEGLGETEVPVTLLRGDDVVQVHPVQVGGAAGASVETTFRVVPSRVGESLWRVQVPVAPGEAATRNNEVSFSVRVVRDRIRVLQACGRPSWDGRFLRELLKRDPAIDLISFFILRSQWDDLNADASELSLIPFPVTELFDEKLEGFDLVIFQNFDFAPYGIEPHLSAVRRVVEELGAGLAIVGGDLSLRGDYTGPDLRAVLPVRLERPASWRGGDVPLARTAEGARHPILQLGFDDDDDDHASDVLRGLLPVTGVNGGLVPRPGVPVLLETADAAQQPVLMASEAGEGRVMLLATDGTWRWSLPTAGRTGSARAYERFWNNALRWLVRDERSALIVVEADRRTVGPGEAATVRARLRDERYEPRAGVPVRFAVRDARGTEVVARDLSTGADGVATLELEAPEAGLYSVTATTAAADGDVDEAGPLFVERVDRRGELDDAAVRPEVLEALARATGGEVRPLAEPLRDVPFTDRREERVESATSWPLWRTWWAWGLVVGLACTEWWLRRRWGLA